MKLRNALSLFRASTSAVPPGAARPTVTLWHDPGGTRPPVSWAPVSGQFETHWDWDCFSALSVPGYWRGRMLISQAIGGMPLGAWRDLVAVEPTPSILREPVPGEDRCNSVAAWACDVLDHGNAVGVYGSPNAEGWWTSITPYRAAETAVWTDPETGRRKYTFYSAGIPSRAYDASEVFHVKGTQLPGDLRGMGVLEAGLSTLERMRSESSYANKAFSNGTPAGLLRVKDPDLPAGTPEDEPGYTSAHGIKKAWKRDVTTGDIAVMSDLVDFTPLAWTPTEAQMTEARQLSLVDIANMLNLDPYWVGSSQTSAPYQNVQDAAVQLSRFTLGFWTTAFEAQFSRALPRGQEARFRRDTILRDNQTVRVDNYVKMIEAGIMDADEVRALEGLPPRDGPAPLASVSPLAPDGDPGTNEGTAGNGAS